MKWLVKMERKFGRYAIKGLMSYIIGFNILVFLFALIDRTGFYYGKIMLIPSLVLQGEIWRLITFIFIPPTFSTILFIFVIYFYYLIGTSLEQEWGSFKFNLYYLLGMVGTIIGSFITGEPTTALYLNLSLFLAFAKLYPNYEILLFFILPVPIKYLAWAEWLFIAVSVLAAPLGDKVAAIASLLNYMLFFGREMVYNAKHLKRSYRNWSNYQEKKSTAKLGYIHRCSICGRTEKDDPHLEFRYCSKCEGDYEYCMDHLRTHEHIRKESEEK